MPTTMPTESLNNPYTLIYAIVLLVVGGGGVKLWDYLFYRLKLKAEQDKGKAAVEAQDSQNAWTLAMTLQEQVVRLSGEVGTLRARLDEVISEKHELQKENAQLRARVESLEGEVKELRANRLSVQT